GQGLEEGVFVTGHERALGQQPLDVPQEQHLLLGRWVGPRHGCSPTPYDAFAGTTQRTPPLGSATSPARRGMTGTWACSTVCPAAGPSLTPTLNPSDRNSVANLARTRATSLQSAACSSSDRSNTLTTCRLGTTSMWPSATGNASGNARAASFSREMRY